MSAADRLDAIKTIVDKASKYIVTIADIISRLNPQQYDDITATIASLRDIISVIDFNATSLQEGNKLYQQLAEIDNLLEVIYDMYENPVYSRAVSYNKSMTYDTEIRRERNTVFECRDILARFDDDAAIEAIIGAVDENTAYNFIMSDPGINKFTIKLLMHTIQRITDGRKKSLVSIIETQKDAVLGATRLKRGDYTGIGELVVRNGLLPGQPMLFVDIVKEIARLSREKVGNFEDKLTPLVDRDMPPRPHPHPHQHPHSHSKHSHSHSKHSHPHSKHPHSHSKHPHSKHPHSKPPRSLPHSVPQSRPQLQPQDSPTDYIQKWRKVAEISHGIVIINMSTSSPITFSIRGLIDKEWIMENNLNTRVENGLSKKILTRYSTTHLSDYRSTPQPMIPIEGKLHTWCIVSTVDGVLWRLMSDKGTVIFDKTPDILRGLSTRMMRYHELMTDRIISKQFDSRSANMIEEYSRLLSQSTEVSKIKLIDELVKRYKEKVSKTEPEYDIIGDTDGITTIILSVFSTKNNPEALITYAAKMETICAEFIKKLYKYSAGDDFTRTVAENTPERVAELRLQQFKYNCNKVYDEMEITETWSSVPSLKEFAISKSQRIF